jgi:hypothetical protein
MAANKLIITGAAATVAEVIVIAYNLRRRLKAKSQDEPPGYVGIYPSGRVSATNTTKKSLLRNILWSANPINIFREA